MVVGGMRCLLWRVLQAWTACAGTGERDERSIGIKDAHVWQNVDGDKIDRLCLLQRTPNQGSNGTEWNTQERLRGI